MSSWPSAVDPAERCRRLLDLFLVSVLLDAGAGTTWQYKSRENGRYYKRSEGLAVVSLEMFQSGLFSSNRSQPHQVDGAGLRRLTVEDMTAALQVSPQNPLVGLDGRTGLLVRLGEALENQTFFGADARPGNMLGMYSPLLLITAVYITAINLTQRLPSHPSINTSVIRSSCAIANAVVRNHGWSRSGLALNPNSNRWRLPW